MKLHNNKEFSWPGLFFVTAASFFIFTLFLKLINGSGIHMKLFFIIGCTALVCGLMSVITLSIKPPEKVEHSRIRSGRE